MDAEFMETLGQLTLDSFALLRALGNGFNAFISVIMFILAVVWIKKMADFNREAAKNGTLK